MKDFLPVVFAIVGLAAIAVLVSTKANTASVIQQTGTSFSAAIGAAVKPITG